MTVTASDTKKCDNLACVCQTPLSVAVCAPYCDSPDARDPAIIACNCGHEVCSATVDAQLHGGIGRESI